MTFIGGMVIGLGAGILLGVLIMSVMTIGKRADQDYESEWNGPDNTRMDRQDGGYGGPASRPPAGF